MSDNGHLIHWLIWRRGRSISLLTPVQAYASLVIPAVLIPSSNQEATYAVRLTDTTKSDLLIVNLHRAAGCTGNIPDSSSPGSHEALQPGNANCGSS